MGCKRPWAAKVHGGAHPWIRYRVTPQAASFTDSAISVITGLVFSRSRTILARLAPQPKENIMRMKHRRSAKILAVTVAGAALIGLGLWLVPMHADAVPSAESATATPCYVIVGQGGCKQTNCCTKSTTPASFCDYSRAHTPSGKVNMIQATKTGGGQLSHTTSVLWCTTWDCGPTGGLCGTAGCGITGDATERYVSQNNISDDCPMAK